MPAPPIDDMHRALLQSRILLVDDSMVSLAFLRNILMRGGFSEICTAENGIEALKLCDSFRPDIIILDLLMEEMDGFECCRRIRTRTEGGDVPILIQTALTDPGDKIRVFRDGATDFITKPIFPDELYARVLVHLEKQFALKRLQSYKQRVQQELSTARDLQMSILPRASEIDATRAQHGLEIASYFKPSSELGGDFWGMKHVAPDSTAFWMVDFSGHGVAAALNVFRLHTCLLEDSELALEPGDYLGEMNERLLQMLPRGQFATMFYGIVDVARDELRYAAAGSPHPLIANYNGTNTQVLDGTGRPLGIGEYYYPTRHAAFMAGDRLCFHSDALTETAGEEGVFIDEAQLSALLAHPAATAESMLQRMVDHYERYTLPHNRRDDLTISLIFRDQEGRVSS